VRRGAAALASLIDSSLEAKYLSARIGYPLHLHLQRVMKRAVQAARLEKKKLLLVGFIRRLKLEKPIKGRRFNRRLVYITGGKVTLRRELIERGGSSKLGMEGCMSKSAMLGMVLAVATVTGGCVVSQSKYNVAVQEKEDTQAELERVQAQKSALEQQVKSLKESSGKLVADAELAQAELQRLKDSRDRERAGIEGRIREQEEKIKDMTAQQRSLRHEMEGAKQRNETLKAAVTRYQKELKERQPVSAPPAQPVAPSPPVPPAPVQATPGPKAPAPQPSVAPVPPGQQGGLAPVNVNKASANDMVLFLGLTKEVAERVVANRPYKVRGELVAKNVLPQATYDVIKDRITLTP